MVDHCLHNGNEPKDWEEIAAQAAEVRRAKRNKLKKRSGFKIPVAFRKHLDDLHEAEHKTEELQYLVDGIEHMIEQPWRALILYFDEDSKCAYKERPWNHKQMSKWRVVGVFLKIAVEYNKACEKAVSDDIELFTGDTDEEILSLLLDILTLGAATQEETIAIREWERNGTMWTLQSRGIVEEDVDREEMWRRMEIEGGATEGNEEESDDESDEESDEESEEE